jgi:hypothetical protein
VSANPGTGIYLGNIASADDPSVHFNANTGVLRVTDPITHTTDKIEIVGGGSFTAGTYGGNPGTLITDPPAGAANDHGPTLEPASFDLPKPEGWVDPNAVVSSSAFDWQGPHTHGASSTTFEVPHMAPLISSHH